MKIKYLFLAVCLLFCSCATALLETTFKGGDWFYFENTGAIMPVWVNGNIQSGIFIIYLHGGPGGNLIDAATTNTFKELQKNYAVVYYDQRGSGTSQGNAKPESLSIGQFIEDLEKIIILIKSKYDNPKLFLLGHSWGSTLATAFLLKQENQSQISGLISINGGHNLEDAVSLSMEWAAEKAAQKASSGINAAHWKKEIIWYNNTAAAAEFKNISRHFRNIDKLDGYFLNPSKSILAPDFPLLNTPYSLFFFLNLVSLISNNSLNLYNYNYLEQMQNIYIPVLILWGKHDGVIPVSLAPDVFESLGSDEKYIFILENSAHAPYIEEQELVFQLITEFIGKIII